MASTIRLAAEILRKTVAEILERAADFGQTHAEEFTVGEALSSIVWIRVFFNETLIFEGNGVDPPDTETPNDIAFQNVETTERVMKFQVTGGFDDRVYLCKILAETTRLNRLELHGRLRVQN